MKAIALCLALLAATAEARPKTCPQFEATRCRGNAIQMCWDDEGKVEWKHSETCVKPEVCVEDEPHQAMCSADNKLVRKLYRGAALAVGFVWAASGGVYRMLKQR